MNISIERKKVDNNIAKPNWNRTAAAGSEVGSYYREFKENSLVPPIRQTASIFKQPVSVYKSQTEGVVKSDLKPTSANQEKPKQLFWEKRLEHLRACDGIDGAEFSSIELPKGLVPVGPFVDEATLLHSVSTSLHTSVATVVGQSKSAITNSVYLDPDQPLMQKLKVDIEDIRKQEERVLLARKKLQEALMK